jgi:hypothetical protein
MMRSSSSSADPTTELPAQVRAALRVLLLGWDYAQKSQRDVWDFAVDLIHLRALGLTKNEIRSLVENEYVQHAVESTASADGRRVFRIQNVALLGDKSCFVLTPAGVDASRLVLPQAGSTPLEFPHYDCEVRELRVGTELVKRLTQPAPDQHLILTAFEEQHWQFRILNPLSPHSQADDASRRLNHTIYRLNHHQVNQLIHFRGDGTAKGIIWEPWGPWRTVR